MRLTKLVSFLLVLACSIPARADQHILLSRENAERAAAYLNKQKEVILYCACCTGDNPLKVSIAEASVEDYKGYGTGVRLKGVDQYKNSINRFVDLAYVWVKSNKEAINFAKVLNLPCRPCAELLDWKSMEEKQAKTETSGLNAKMRAQVAYLTKVYTSKDSFTLVTQNNKKHKVYSSYASYDSVLHRFSVQYKTYHRGFHKLQYTIDFRNVQKVKAKGNMLILHAKKDAHFSLTDNGNRSIITKQFEYPIIHLAFRDPSQVKKVKKSAKLLCRRLK